MKHDEKERKKENIIMIKKRETQLTIMKNRDKTMKNDEKERKTMNSMKNREKTMNNDEKERTNNETWWKR